MNEQPLDLRDIHLPEPISWWPIAPGWWMLVIGTIIILSIVILARRIYKSKQLKRDIRDELDSIKQTFQETSNRSQLAKSLSILLRRASISFYPSENIAGLTGKDWLVYLDDTNASSNKKVTFNSETGRTLLSAPYLPDNSQINFDTEALITLCEAWLLSPHSRKQRREIS